MTWRGSGQGRSTRTMTMACVNRPAHQHRHHRPEDLYPSACSSASSSSCSLPPKKSTRVIIILINISPTYTINFAIALIRLRIQGLNNNLIVNTLTRRSGECPPINSSASIEPPVRNKPRARNTIKPKRCCNHACARHDDGDHGTNYHNRVPGADGPHHPPSGCRKSS